MADQYIDLPEEGTRNVNIFDSEGNPLNSSSGSLDVTVTGSTPITGTVKIEDTAGNALTSTSGALDVFIENFPATQPVSGIVTAKIEDSAGNALTSTSGSLNVDVTNTVPISGSISATQGTTPWVDNITQFGNSPVVIGTGASGAGIPRVTVSNDSNILATQSGTWTTRIEDSSGNSLTSTSGALNVNSSGTSTVSGTVSTNQNGLTNFQTSQYTIGTSAVQLTSTPMTNRSSMSMKANTTSSTQIIYIGNSSGVTTSTGYALFGGDSLQLDLTGANSIYAIASAASQTLFVLEIGN
jgi:hypothetical protein